jgi:hypothetical protein
VSDIPLAAGQGEEHGSRFTGVSRSCQLIAERF